MERTGVLIERLLQQYHDNVDADKMLFTVQLLAGELQQQAAASEKQKRVAVVLPRHVTQAIVTGAPVEKPAPEPSAPVIQVVPQQAEKPQEKPEVPLPPAPQPETPPVPPAPLPSVPEPEPAPEPVPPPVVTEAPKPVTEQPVITRPPLPELPKTRQPWQQEPAMAIPTLAHQQRELNEAMNANRQSLSLNERLRANNVELGTILQSSPVRDLKKAIGINDRYVFINELFRGDENMYERSIKTINNFSNYAEAEFWIRRELKLKLAWHDDAESVHQFDQLVKRRFS